MKLRLRWKIPVVARISIGLTGLMISALMFVSLLGMFPDRQSEVQRRRKLFCESAAITISLMAEKANARTMQTYLESLAQRDPDVQTLGVRREDGTLVVDIGNHEVGWDATKDQNESQIWVPFYAGNQPWGRLESVFAANHSALHRAALRHPQLLHGLSVAVLCLTGFYMYLRFVLKHLDPSRVIPNRVREALDALAEGLLVLDGQFRIVLANRAFEDSTGAQLDKLLGSPVERISFVSKDEHPVTSLPWEEALETAQRVTGRLLGVQGQDDRTFSVSASPIVDEKGKLRGVLASFEDVTRLEEKKRELSGMVEYLRASSEAIKQQNKELERLAVRDPLTGCLNRRSFFERFDAQWTIASRYDHALSAMMVDIDYFKAINDDYGHGMGDEVLRKVAATLQEAARETDIVCRYGGEEFAVLLPSTELSEAAIAAERVRTALEVLSFRDFSITASIGVATRSEDSATPQELLDQADKCLYVAKRGGRNRVVRSDDVPDNLVVDESKINRTKESTTSEPVSVPYHAVTALISALAYRDQRTAEHSRRVADLCVATAEGLLSLQDCYYLEIAALLHDIGKIGVPDSILLKPGSLTEHEWKVMRRNDTIGIEIIRASFGSPQLTSIVEHCRAHYGDPNVRPSSPSGNRIPVGSRILAIADAYDAMTTDQEFRSAHTMTEATAELRRCAGSQFDPELVERFVSIVGDQPAAYQPSSQTVSKETALAIGLQLERLSQVLDEQDFDALDAIARRLQSTASKYGAESISNKAADLGVILDADRDPHAIIRVANELLDLCRSTQQSFLDSQPFSANNGDDSAAVGQEQILTG